ncbi:double-stranded DNA-binding domain-containing protein [Diaporthe sp. PMI_573]|nr:double-stranded DNA-binding domain-containing protein [Diaporthaceae sp. PMI_573]
MRSWQLEGEQVSVWKGLERSSRGRGRAEAEWIGRGRNEPSNEHIDQLIVTLACGVTKNALENVVHRIDNRTTICLVQDGLGVVEHLNATLFPDPMTRPHYVLGHMAASLGYNKKWFFGARLGEPGKLYLHAVEKGIDLEPLFKFYPPVERRSNATQFLRTLVTTPGLHAGGYNLENWLIKKLPALVFNSVIEPMAVILDTTYDTLPRNEHAIQLADELLDELFNVIMALPELTNSSKVVKHCGLGELRKKTIRRLWEKGSSQSNMLSRVRAGQWVDIDYMNGYFVRRARELGIKVPQNEVVVDMVKARIAKRREEMNNTIPFESDNIRKARLEQLKAQSGGGAGAGAGAGGSGQGQAEQQNRQQEAEARQSILNQILHPEAADRLGRIRLVKEERAADVENRLIMLARSGQLQQKVTEAQLKDLLSAVSANQEKEKIVVNRRKAWADEDDDLLDL